MCENSIIKDVMTTMGWQDSFVPYASDENKKIMDAIKFFGNTKLDRATVLEAQDKEASRVRELFNSVDGEFDQNLKLLTAHKSQYSTEYHLFKLAEHDDTKFKKMLKEIEKISKEQTLEQENLKSEFRLLIMKSIGRKYDFSHCLFLQMKKKGSVNRLTS